MAECKEKLIALIRGSGIAPDDAQIWEKIVSNIAEEFCSDVLETLSRQPERLGFITGSIKEKISVVESGRLEEFDKLLRSEDAFIKSLALQQ